VNKKIIITILCPTVLASMAFQGCGTSAGTSASPNSSTQVTNLASGISKINSIVSGGAPQVKPAAAVAFYSPMNRFKRFGRKFSLFPTAYASTSSLSAIWGTPSVLPTLSTQVSLPNDFYGGTGTGVTSSPPTFTCTDAALYCPVPGTYNTEESLVDYVGQELVPSFFNTNDSSVTLFGRLYSGLSTKDPPAEPGGLGS